MPLFKWLKSSDGLNRSKILGTSPISIDLAEDREFAKILDELNIRQPLNGLARTENGPNGSQKYRVPFGCKTLLCTR